jgi:predicted ATPase
MRFKYIVRGLGNIDEATIDIAPFTLIAGQNNSGKSFTTKSLYCILEALNDNYLAETLSKLYDEMRFNFFNFIQAARNLPEVDVKFIELFENDFLETLRKFIVKLKNNDEDILAFYKEDLMKHFYEINNYFLEKKDVKQFKNSIIYINRIVNKYKELLFIIDNPEDIIVNGIDENLNKNFKKNFEVTALAEILNKFTRKKLLLKLEDIGNVQIGSKSDKLEFSFLRNGVKQIQKLSNVLYIDSPVYLRLFKALRRKNILEALLDDKYLRSYPLYIEKFYEFVEQKYIDKSNFLQLSSKIQEIIGGKIKLNKENSLEYITNNVSIPISLTAMGVANIGTIDLLIRNNSINKGSFLIIDEPEAHLHPEWQVKFVHILYEIAKAGANVIVTSHSIDIVKAIELLAKKDDKNIAINKMPYSDEFENKTNAEKIREILKDLSSPFYKMYMEGL